MRQNSSKATLRSDFWEKKSMKGIPWTVEEENALRELIEAQTPLPQIAAKLGKQTANVLVKCRRLGLTLPDQTEVAAIALPAELPTVEETLKILAGAMKAACGSA